MLRIIRQQKIISTMMKSFLFSLFLPLISFLFLSTPAWSSWSDSAMEENLDATVIKDKCYTPPNLQEIFLEVCKRVLENDDQCIRAWEAFTCAFGEKNDITPNDYNPYFNVIPVVSEPNTVLFWSGVMNVVDEVSLQPKISSSANQKSSKILNIMENEYNVKCWCGNNTSIIDTVHACPSNTTYAFWEQFSILLANSTRGIAFWAGYGNRKKGAYSPTSFFAKYEFPYLDPERVKKLVIIDIYHDNGEQCSQGSLLKLHGKIVEKYGRNGYRCYETKGDPNNKTQVDALAKTTLFIIRKEQNAINWYVW